MSFIDTVSNTVLIFFYSVLNYLMNFAPEIDTVRQSPVQEKFRELYYANSTSAKSIRCEEKYGTLHSCYDLFNLRWKPCTLFCETWWSINCPPLDSKRFSFFLSTNHHGPLRMDHTGSDFSHDAQCFQTSFPRHSQVSHNHPHHGSFYPARIKFARLSH